MRCYSVFLKAYVLIAAEETLAGIGRIRLAPIVDASSEVLKEATLQMVNPGSTVHTDAWDGYNALTSCGYIHIPIRHKETESGDSTPLAHRVAAFLKRWWLGTHQGAAMNICNTILMSLLSALTEELLVPEVNFSTA